ncbi:MAG: RNA methyltransferase [Ilumatobacteraceae bacterium]|jgi:tRNA G18 (ribose-2'-O)-methylase SpoU|nr:RNA methyltransferase [Ilumatobacteraceae bacterium]
MIHSVANALDERLDPFRWRDRQLASKSDRRETVGAGLFVAEGDLVVDRALQAGCTPQALLCDDDMAARFHSQLPHVDIFCGNEDLRRDVTGLGVPLRAVGLFQRPPLRDVSELLHSGSRIVVAESLDNPTNLGAIIRSAAALGWHGLVLSAGSADPLARRALRVSMGTGLTLPFARLQDDESLHELLTTHGYRSVALTPHHTGVSLQQYTVRADEKVAVLLGSERDGLATETIFHATDMVRIPMHAHVDSLNVGAAAAIVLYALGPQTNSY